MRIFGFILLSGAVFSSVLGGWVNLEKRATAGDGNSISGAEKPLLKPLSNAVLLSAGLRPRAPKFLQRAVAKRRPSPVEMAPRQIVTTTPIAGSGMIIVNGAGGVPIGFVGPVSSDSVYTLTTDPTQALKVLIFNLFSTSGFIDLIAENDGPSAYVGITTPFSGDFTTGSAQYGYMSPVSESYLPNIVNPRAEAGESTIWAIDPITLALTASWHDPNTQTSDPLTVFYDSGNLMFTGDFMTYEMTYNNEIVEEVTLTFAPI
ncbi:hypothetical protein SISSUDRAFT_1066529 [Sistotremastrum suecicum HHB10207 ss-3]|uniref:Uncharacterized protein n=1 Tax=Sistotremastrum suecicum HHB10207 ss-3 TaxID=1314776 RepID=A0A165Y7L0_9AGAM|nr:hypothetical protein SISSUDRAFT_1066529 [Sistotremastrum suecicum HHB10207 ss-3]